MLERIELKNFGCHRKLSIEFSPLVTTIVGSSFAGKSTIIRALKWVARNKPSGDNFINWDSERTAVRLTADGHQIIRKKGKNINLYKLDGEEYKAFKNDVPENIKTVLNLGPLNFQRSQHDAPFWFCETAGEVSRQLNAIVNLEVIDETLSSLDSKIREHKTEIKITEKRLEGFSEDKKTLEFVEEMRGEFEELSTKYHTIEKLSKRCEGLTNTLSAVTIYQKRHNHSVAAALFGEKANERGRLYKEILGQVQYLQNFLRLISNIEKDLLKPPSLEPLEKKKGKWEFFIQRANLLNILIKEAEDYKELICQMKEKLKRTKKELKKVAGKNCPLCGQKMP